VRATTSSLRLALCQMNATVGDIDGNIERIRAGQLAARDARADLVLFPELAVTGYPPEDLLLREDFLARARAALEELAAGTHGPIAVVGFPERAEDVYNAAAVLADGAIRAIYRKVYLPNYGVFDEQRYFQAGSAGAVLDVGSHRIGLTVCEDVWEPGPPATEEALAGATLIVNISASPYHAGKGAERERMFAQRARDNLAYVAFCGLVGGQDELVFDGHSCVIDHTGETIARAAQFREELLVCDVHLDRAAAARLREAGHRPTARSPGTAAARILPPLPARAHDPAASPVAPSLAVPITPVEARNTSFGLHAAALAAIDAVSYWSTARRTLASTEFRRVEEQIRCGVLFKILSAVGWETIRLAAGSEGKAMRRLRIYAPQLTASTQALGLEV